MRLIKRLVRRDEGQDLIEYALLATLIVLTVAFAVESLGVSVGDYVNGVLGRAVTFLATAGG